MEQRSIVICGLPESGKTTFLAALWHLVSEREIPTALRFDSLKNGDHGHLNAIADRWREAKPQERTEIGSRRVVTMNLLNSSENPVRVEFPDLSGETYRRMWEDRDCSSDVGDILMSGQGILLFVHSDRISPSRSVLDETTQMKALGLDVSGEAEEKKWDPSLSPTQVKLVDILQMLNSPPLDIGPRRLAIMLSAWDKVLAEGRTPSTFLKEWLPLLHQYLQGGNGLDAWSVYGVSAQGGDFGTEAQDLLAKDKASMRIRLFSDAIESHDLTEPLSWLMQ